MRIDTKKLLENAQKNYERTWAESAKLLKVKGKYFSLEKKRKTHPLFDQIFEARNIFLDMGFAEVVTPLITEECHVYLQYGPEAPVILDRIFYLAGLPRTDIGISNEKVSEIRRIIPNFDGVKELQHIFRKYKKGQIESDDLTETLVEELKIREEQATQIISLFPEFSQLRPVPTKLTLRSHTTSSWFPILREMQHKETLPLQLFSISPKFRREQKLDVKHLYESWTASIVIMAEEISLEDGQEIVERFLSELGFGEVELRIKRATSKYYAPKTEFEAFVRHPKNGELIEVGDGGLYNPLSLARYQIPYPVFNFGAGLERMAMIKTGIDDIRKLVYPHLYAKPDYTDTQLAEMVEVDQTPLTREGENLVRGIVQTALKNANQPSPCQFLVYKGKFLDHNIEVHVYESDKGKKLIGPAALNRVYVYDGNILGIPKEGLENTKIVKMARKKGVSTGIRYLDAIAALAAASIEKKIKAGEIGEIDVRVKIAKLPSDVNLRVQATGIACITSENKKIIVKGPVFIGIKAQIM